MSESPLEVTFGSRLNAYLTTFEDFHKHRKRTNKSILKLRHELNLITKDTRNYKEKEKTSAISSADYDSDVRYGSLLLLLAERDSLYASEMASLHNVSGRNLSSYRKLRLTKLKKAVSTTTKLLSVVENEQNAIRKLEFYIYAALANGVYASNRKQWSHAVYALSVARCGVELLGSKTEDDVLNKALIDELLETWVDPSLQLAVSQNENAMETTSDLKSIARKHCHDSALPVLAPAVNLISSIDSSFVQPLEEEEFSKTITWRNHEASIYNDELALKIARLTRADWTKYSDLNEYDLVLSQWAELVDIHSSDLQKNKDEDDAEKVQDGAVLLTYLKYNLLFTKLKRDLLLISQVKDKPSRNCFTSTAGRLHNYNDVLRLYSSIVSTTEELKDLPGVYNDEDLHESLDNMLRFFTVQRSVIVAESYAMAEKFPEALKIFSHLQRTFTAGDLYKVESFPYDVTSNAQADELVKHIQDRLLKMHSLAQFQKEQKIAQGDNSYVVENVNHFPVSSVGRITNVAQVGKIAPVLPKAVLFDVAYNYISYSAEKSQSGESESADKKKSGFFGIFGRK